MFLTRLPQMTVMVALSAALSACTPAVPSATTSAVAHPTPAVSAIEMMTEDDALTVATSLLEQYETQRNAMMADPSVDVSVLRPLMTDAGYEFERAGRARSIGGTHTVGTITFRNFLLQDFDAGGASFSVLYCGDLANVRVVDGSGTDVTPADRANEATFKATFKRDGQSLLIDRNEGWFGASQCV